MTGRNFRHCADCDNLKIHLGRGLCSGCYSRHQRNGTLDDLYPRSRSMRPNADVIEDYGILRARGLTQVEVASKLDMKVSALRAAIYRARAAGKAVAA